MPKRTGPRDTAKDIILGLEPSGQGPREPREGRMSAVPKNRAVNGAEGQQPYQGSGGRPGVDRPKSKSVQPNGSSVPPPPRPRPIPVAPVTPLPQRDPLIDQRLAGTERTTKGMMDELARLQAQLRDYQNQHAQAISNE
uniref:Uncharacterized protein n=2 Tax=Plectus sambesii TaxID=2011161 RepID=A0A914VCU0_9BILA